MQGIYNNLNLEYNKNQKELKRLKNSLALKAVLKIVIYTFFVYTISMLLIDNIFNDSIAEYTSYELGRDTYLKFVQNKKIILIVSAIIIFIVIAYLVIRKMNNTITETIIAMDKLLKNPDEEIKLSNNLLPLENRINSIRVDLIKSQNEAKEAMQKKDNLVMYMAHDLKTPLTSIIGYLSLLNEEKDISDSLKKKYLKIALDKSLRLEELTNQFFDITRYNLQDIPINKTQIDLSYLFDQLIEECYPMLENKKLKVTIKKPDKLNYFGDGDKLARAFENLIKNAINYSYENSEIIIDIKQIGKSINIIFRNKCDKIPEYKLEKIFDQFYRADSSRTSSTGGAGLGLAITKKIIELHDGNIKVKNDDEYIEFDVNL